MIEKRLIRKEEDGYYTGQYLVKKSCDDLLYDGATAYGWFEKTIEGVGPGSNTSLGRVMFMGEEKVTVERDGKFKDFTLSYFKMMVSRYVFICKEVEGERMRRYEIAYYLENINQDHPNFTTDVSMQDFIDVTSSHLLSVVRSLSDDFFIQSKKPLYHKRDISRSNLIQGKRYRKLVFVRQIGAILTRLYYPEVNIAKTTSLWGYGSHATFYYSLDKIENNLFYDNLSHVIEDTFNEVRQVFSPVRNKATA